MNKMIVNTLQPSVFAINVTPIQQRRESGSVWSSASVSGTMESGMRFDTTVSSTPLTRKKVINFLSSYKSAKAVY